ncbi:glycoside hydrolase family 19 protein [Pararoseomonas indoligenes]|uniref:Chitinase n=1 Tax=Roseomonas indoligenes TaxID=2820811 RepID=A0A940MQH2_9PROT|nr:hypothetical protein [Pararoseomonas indoligenes]MBP0492138.1 hypothetical protein [Pararoseomonas indoligenes]
MTFWSSLINLFNRQPGETGAVLGVPAANKTAPDVNQIGRNVNSQPAKSPVSSADVNPPPIPVLTAAETPMQPVPGLYTPGQAATDPLITSPVLRALGWTDPVGYAPAMDAACARYGITGRQRMACFLAQVGHESLKGFYTKEVWGPTKAQAGYEGRIDLGNTQPGDGSRFRGRGLIQVTGRANYTKAAKALGKTLDELPAWLEGREGAVTSAAWWWEQAGCNALADKATSRIAFDSLTRRINGGLNGGEERWKLYQAALKALG